MRFAFPLGMTLKSNREIAHAVKKKINAMNGFNTIAKMKFVIAQ